ncbi:hypothetical protein P7C73_g4355, partial [Tremellales sp. Uapishka_1]
MQAVNSVVETVREKIVTKPREPEDWLLATDVEEIAEDEDETIDEIAELIKKMMDHNFDAHQHKFRGTHVKSLAFVKGTLAIDSDLPKHLQQGIFVPGKKYDCIARFANEPSFIMDDKEKAPRGLGLKIFEVEGERLEQDPGNHTQDFLFNNAPMVETTKEIFELREKHFDSPKTLQLELAKRSDRLKQFAPTMLPNTFVIGATMYTQSAFSFGPYVAHLSLVPTTPEQEELATQTIPSDVSATFHREHLQTYFKSNAASYKIRAQFCSSTTAHPIEDASTAWDSVTSPWIDLGELRFDSQESYSNQRRIWWEDTVALSPWNGVVDHRPLGSINRLRKRVYRAGRGHRGEGNLREIKFPKSVDEMPE